MDRSPLNVILITIDALRYDRLSINGYKNRTTPHLESWMSRSINFTNVFSNATNTPSSFGSMFSSSYPLMYNGYNTLSQSRPFLPEILHNNGIHTIGINSNPFLSKYYGYDRGFDTFIDFFSPDATSKAFRALKYKWGTYYRLFLTKYFQYPYVPGNKINEHVKKALKKKKDRSRFLWIHYMDTHAPYYPMFEVIDGSDFTVQEIIDINERVIGNNKEPATSNDKERISQLYDLSVQTIDNYIHKLLQYIFDTPHLRNSIIIITSDHGEELFDHGDVGHLPKLYDELLHVPFILIGDSIDENIGDTSDTHALNELLNLSPTILDWFNIEKPREFIGRPLMDHRSPYIFADIASRPGSVKVNYAYRNSGIRTDSYKYIYSNADEEMLFDLRSDSKEINNIAQDHQEITDAFRDLVGLHRTNIEKHNVRFIGSRLRNEDL